LTALPGRTLILARLLSDEGEVTPAAAAVNARRGALGDSVRTAAFTSLEPARDVIRLAANYDVELVLLDDGSPEQAAVAEHATASPAIQRVVGVAAEPLLTEPAEDALRSAVESATVVVTGFPARWPAEEVVDVRLTLAHGGPPLLLVHRGTRPGVLAPRESL